MTGHDEHATTVPDERRWEYRPMSALGRYELLYNGRVLAEAWWLHELAYPAVTMTRLVDRLNLPAAECAPSVAPTWTDYAVDWVEVRYGGDDSDTAVRVLRHNDDEQHLAAQAGRNP